MVHFFLYDYKFEDVWLHPDKYVERMKKYRAMLTPDFSMYIEMHPIMQLYNTFRNRWVGAYYAEKGIKIIPTVSWGLKNTFNFCFNGIEKGSSVAISTYMVSEHNNHSDQKDFFLKGYNELLRRIKPEKIIGYNQPFPEMEGDIVFVDCDLSSWRYMGDDKAYVPSAYAKYICGAEPWPENCPIIRKTGYILPNNNYIMGMGSSERGSWRPSLNKPDDQRLLGEPGSVNKTVEHNKNYSFDRLTKIGEDGKAVMGRHETDHRMPGSHSNPHDHPIDWSKGFPHFGKQINYLDGAPELKNYTRRVSIVEKKYMDIDYSNQDLNFHTISEFKWCMIQGGEVEFCVGERIFGIFPLQNRTPESPDQIVVCELCVDNQQETKLWADTADDALEYMIDGVRLRDIITKVEVTGRTI